MSYRSGGLLEVWRYRYGNQAMQNFVQKYNPDILSVTPVYDYSDVDNILLKIKLGLPLKHISEFKSKLSNIAKIIAHF